LRQDAKEFEAHRLSVLPQIERGEPLIAQQGGVSDQSVHGAARQGCLRAAVWLRRLVLAAQQLARFARLSVRGAQSPCVSNPVQST